LADGVLDAAISARLEANWAPRGEARSQAWIDRCMKPRDGVAQGDEPRPRRKTMVRGAAHEPWPTSRRAARCSISTSASPTSTGCGDHSNLARLADKLAARKSFVDTVPQPEYRAAQSGAGPPKAGLRPLAGQRTQ